MKNSIFLFCLIITLSGCNVGYESPDIKTSNKCEGADFTYTNCGSIVYPEYASGKPCTNENEVCRKMKGNCCGFEYFYVDCVCTDCKWVCNITDCSYEECGDAGLDVSVDVGPDLPDDAGDKCKNSSDVFIECPPHDFPGVGSCGDHGPCRNEGEKCVRYYDCCGAPFPYVNCECVNCRWICACSDCFDWMCDAGYDARTDVSGLPDSESIADQ